MEILSWRWVIRLCSSNRLFQIFFLSSLYKWLLWFQVYHFCVLSYIGKMHNSLWSSLLKGTIVRKDFVRYWSKCFWRVGKILVWLLKGALYNKGSHMYLPTETGHWIEHFIGVVPEQITVVFSIRGFLKHTANNAVRKCWHLIEFCNRGVFVRLWNQQIWSLYYFFFTCI